MLDITLLRKEKKFTILSLGSYPGIIQSILDFDFLSGKEKPSLVGIIAGGRRSERYFFGKKEILLPVFSSLSALPKDIKESVNFFLNVTSGRRVLESSVDALENIPSVIGGIVFAENVPEAHAIALQHAADKKNAFIVGPASVGILLPKQLKLGAIGGVDMHQFVDAHIFTPGDVAVFSSSGGMTNELINIVASAGKRISFALSFGGDRFPATTPLDAFLAAERDPQTKYIVYFGELGGYDEYDIANAIQIGKITKPVLCYIAGVISDMFKEPPQFGHAKAMAGKGSERAVAKREALQQAGAFAANSFEEFVEKIGGLESAIADDKTDYATLVTDMTNRQHALIASSVSKDIEGEVHVLGENLLSFAKNNSFAFEVGSLFIGRKLQSKDTEQFIDFVLRLLVDHGPYVSGAVNTIVTARAGANLVSSLSAGLLTIGPRFGGAINDAAGNWLRAVQSHETPYDFVESFAKQKKYILGIGHRKYRIDFPDPRVNELLQFIKELKNKRFTDFAKEVEKITTAKKGNLILNVDGTIAAVLLDILSEKEGLSDEELRRLVDTEFFNALFVLSRSVGFIAHFLDQKRLDEGLFRLTEDQVAEA